VENSRIPIIIAGDFNDTPASYIYQQATKMLCDPYVEQGRGFGTTYHGPYPAFRIDYILHSEDIKALSYKRIKTNISDHYPIVVQFDLAPQPEEE
jgi:endonuclease/exonuclease/phosphatase (EEP) superfamily protein YafD